MLTNDVINNLCCGKNPDDPVSVDELKHALRLVLETTDKPAVTMTRTSLTTPDTEESDEDETDHDSNPEDLTEAELEKLTNPDTEETDEDETDG